jgi:hypothetical protein
MTAQTARMQSPCRTIRSGPLATAERLNGDPLRSQHATDCHIKPLYARSKKFNSRPVVPTIVGIPVPVHALEPVGDGQVLFFSALTPLLVISNYALAYGLVSLIRSASKRIAGIWDWLD